MPTLTKTQKNEVLARVRGAGLDPLDFVWVERKSPEWSRWEGYAADTLVHKPTGYYCAVFAPPQAVGLMHLSDRLIAMPVPGPYVAVFEPVNSGPRGRLVSVDLSSVLTGVAEWLDVVKREHEAPDLWAQLAVQGDVFGDAVSALEIANTPFTADEKRRITQGLDEIKAQLAAQHELSEQQLTAIDKGFAALKAASERVGRKDWVLMFGGMLMGIIGSAALPPETVRGLFHIVGQVFQWLLQQGRLLPPFP